MIFKSLYVYLFISSNNCIWCYVNNAKCMYYFSVSEKQICRPTFPGKNATFASILIKDAAHPGVEGLD